MTKVILAFSVSLAVGGMTGCTTPAHEPSPPSRSAVTHKEGTPSSPTARKGAREEGGERALTQETPPTDRAVPSDPTVPADDTGRNVRDRDARTLTPMDQSSDAGDVEITRRIRKALMADDTLSTTAKNIKIITVNGTATLRGPVETAGERLRILNKANTVAHGHVVNQLEVTSR
jgi:hyperosmotically inducible periplasmic protein